MAYIIIYYTRAMQVLDLFFNFQFNTRLEVSISLEEYHVFSGRVGEYISKCEHGDLYLNKSPD